MNKPFSVNVLLYGDHLALAQRCLDSILSRLDPAYVAEIRIGLNEVCAATKAYVLEQTAPLADMTLIYESAKNACKYPMMRRMFFDAERPIQSPYIMWFDDDSAIVGPPEVWWCGVYDAMARSDMLGDIWFMDAVGNQLAAVQAQPWYGGKKFRKNPRRGRECFHFATGGWWCIRTDIVRKWNYPWPELKHNGGDRMLGELLHQQGLTLRQFNSGVWINADAEGRRSMAPRRGVSTYRNPLWHDYVDGIRYDLSHQQFDCLVYRPYATSTKNPLPVKPGYIELPGF